MGSSGKYPRRFETASRSGSNPLSEPLFLLGALFIIVVMFLPGGIAGTIDGWWRRRHGERHVRDSLRSIDDAEADADAVGASEVRA